MDPVARNAEHWDVRAEAHARGTGRFYDTDALARGEDPLWEVERAALARVAPDGVAGLDVLHLQCHLAGDAIHFARSGARVTGLDLSPVALAAAAARAARCGVEVRLVEADASAPPAELHGAFDVVWATIGVTCWAFDLDRWTAAAASMLRPGGRLALVELHPAYNMLESVDPPVADIAWGGGALLTYESSSSYDNPDMAIRRTSGTVAAWGIDDHIGATIRAGLVVEHLDEHLDCEHDPRGLLAPDADGRYRVRLGPGQPPLPILFTLVAVKPAPVRTLGPPAAPGLPPRPP